jgi:hypothetical protein
MALELLLEMYYYHYHYQGRGMIEALTMLPCHCLDLVDRRCVGKLALFHSFKSEFAVTLTEEYLRTSTPYYQGGSKLVTNL